MKVRVKLVAYLGEPIPGIDDEGEGTMELPQGATVSDALEALDVAAAELYLTLVNDEVVGARQQEEWALSDGDLLTVFPPIKGG